MKNGVLRGIIIVAVLTLIGFTGGFILSQKNASDSKAAIELGMKVSDVKWLARVGKISQEEVDKINDSLVNVNIKEANKLIDEILEGKEKEYLAEQAELKEMIQSIRND